MHSIEDFIVKQVIKQAIARHDNKVARLHLECPMSCIVFRRVKFSLASHMIIRVDVVAHFLIHIWQFIVCRTVGNHTAPVHAQRAR